MYKELTFDEGMMTKTSAIINLISNPFEVNLKLVSQTIQDTLTEETFNKLFVMVPKRLRIGRHLFNFFVTMAPNQNDLKRIFPNVVIHKGTDDEKEYVAALEINNRIVLLLCSPQRGSQIRIQDDNYTITMKEVVGIVKTLCEIYNEKL